MHPLRRHLIVSALAVAPNAASAANQYVNTETELRDAAAVANAGDDIILTGDITMTGSTVVVDGGVTVRSDDDTFWQLSRIEGPNDAEPILRFTNASVSTVSGLRMHSVGGQLVDFDGVGEVTDVLVCPMAMPAGREAFDSGDTVTLRYVVFAGLTGNGDAVDDTEVNILDSTKLGDADWGTTNLTNVVDDAYVPLPGGPLGCGDDGRPPADWPGWGTGGYVDDHPFPGWDDADADGYPYGPDSDPRQDCDDAAVDGRHAGADEVCDGLDNNCDGATDDADPALEGILYYPDADDDGYGDENGVGMVYCYPPTTVVANNDDCDDTNVDVNPEGDERAGDGVDQDCDGNDAPPSTDTDADADTDTDADADADADTDADADADTAGTDTAAGGPAPAPVAVGGCRCAAGPTPSGAPAAWLGAWLVFVPLAAARRA